MSGKDKLISVEHLKWNVGGIKCGTLSVDYLNWILDHEEPAVDAEPVKRGKWKWLSCTYDRVPKEMEYECSECHHKTIVHGDNMPWEKYCPQCGCRMDEE